MSIIISFISRHCHYFKLLLVFRFYLSTWQIHITRVNGNLVFCDILWLISSVFDRNSHLRRMFVSLSYSGANCIAYSIRSFHICLSASLIYGQNVMCVDSSSCLVNVKSMQAHVSAHSFESLATKLIKYLPKRTAKLYLKRRSLME